MARRLLILAYHRVLESADPLRRGDILAADFARQMAVLSRFYNVLPLREAVQGLRNGTLPARAVAITFDDGYADNYSIALPILMRFGLPATIFVATSFLDGGRMWNDTVIEAVRAIDGNHIDLSDLGLGRHPVDSDSERAKAATALLNQLKYREADERDHLVASIAESAGGELPQDLMLKASEVRELSRAGIEIGAHTVNHPILTSVDPDTAAYEIAESKRRLEEITGKPIRSFAYPNGRPGVDYEDNHVRLVRDAGFDIAVATCLGAADKVSDPLQLPRFGPWGESSLRFGARMLKMLWE
jgi:peptidoglycan/xylan/chitin deacetylase (PgdA/CDA1 family)